MGKKVIKVNIIQKIVGNLIPFLTSILPTCSFSGVCVALVFSFLCCVVFFVCFFFRPVSCAPNIASVSGLLIFDCHFRFV